MKNPPVQPEPTVSKNEPYEMPVLTLIGDAADVVLGLPGDGWDGPTGLSFPQFEFEEDDVQS